MARAESMLTQKGQVTIPADMRRQLGIEPHDRVRFELTNGSITITPVRSRLAEFYGSVAPRNRPEDWKAIREEFEQAVADEVVSEDP